MVDFKAIASKPELIGCTSFNTWRNNFHGTNVLQIEKYENYFHEKNVNNNQFQKEFSSRVQ